MPLHIHCDTATATLLLAVECEDKLLRFPNDQNGWPGLTVKVDPMLGINGQLLERVKAEPGLMHTPPVSIWQEYSARLEPSPGRDISTLYVAVVRPGSMALQSMPWTQWQTLPEIIRSLPKDRNRLAYLKAWQVLSGALTETTKALDIDEVSRYIKSLDNGV